MKYCCTKMEENTLKIRKYPNKENPTRVKLLMTEFITHDVKRFILEKPKGYEFLPGQATSLSIPNSNWQDELREFSFTSGEHDQVLEFSIKAYADHNGVTKQLHTLEPGSELMIHEPFGTIQYKGKGVFLAGGTGITPFVSIFRHLHKTNQLEGNTLIFSNKEVRDIILEKELRQILGDNLILTLTSDDTKGYEHGRIGEALIQKYAKNLDQNFYICGPDPFVIELKSTLEKMGVKEENIIVESFIVEDE
jgi:ferredoxin-NADP reductase